MLSGLWVGCDRGMLSVLKLCYLFLILGLLVIEKLSWFMIFFSFLIVWVIGWSWLIWNGCFGSVGLNVGLMLLFCFVVWRWFWVVEKFFWMCVLILFSFFLVVGLLLFEMFFISFWRDFSWLFLVFRKVICWFFKVFCELVVLNVCEVLVKRLFSLEIKFERFIVVFVEFGGVGSCYLLDWFVGVG